MNSATRLLESERKLESDFVSEQMDDPREPKGWPAALIFFHIAQWRARLRSALTDVNGGRPYTLAARGNIDELNDAELPEGAGLSLEMTSARSAQELAALIEVSEALGERPFEWSVTTTTGEALIRNSYLHPRTHLAAFYRENGEADRADALVEETVAELRDASASPVLLGAALYNLACVRVAQGRHEDALSLLEQALPMRPDLAASAPADRDLSRLVNEPRFKVLISSS